MKRKYSYFDGKKQTEREYSYIPFRYILAVFIALFEVLAVIGIVTALCYYVPYFYIAAWATEIFCEIRIIASDDNPDYKVPWLLFVLIIPVAGFQSHSISTTGNYTNFFHISYLLVLNGLLSFPFFLKPGYFITNCFFKAAWIKTKFIAGF